MTKRQEFIEDVANIIRYAFREKMKLEDLKNLEVDYDPQLHRQMRFGVYCRGLANLEIYDKAKYWVDGVINEDYSVNGRPIIGTSIDFTIGPLLSKNILVNMSLLSSQDLASNIRDEVRQSNKEFLTDKECDELLKKYIGDGDD